MFRRSKTDQQDAATATATTTTATTGAAAGGAARAQGKGRPTPTRKEAEAAARARAKAPRTRKELARAQREARAESSQRMRQGLRSGDERYFPPRDRGPVRRFLRDLVDSRFSFTELMIPLLILSMVLGYSGNPDLRTMSSLLLLATLVLVIVDLVGLRFRVKRQLARRFPDQSHKGTTYYALSRALQMRFMRMPKSQVRIGQQLPEHYR